MARIVDMYLAAFDTGRRSGYAIYETFGYCQLVECGTFQSSLPNIYAFFDKWSIGHVVAEKPQHYQTHLSKGDPNKLTPLAVECGQIAGIAYCAGIRSDGSDGIDPENISLPYPSTWKGQLPKQVAMRRAKGLLTHNELALAGSDNPHDKWDAIGLGLYELDRIGLRRGWK